MPQSLEKGESPETWVIKRDFAQKIGLVGSYLFQTLETVCSVSEMGMHMVQVLDLVGQRN